MLRDMISVFVLIFFVVAPFAAIMIARKKKPENYKVGMLLSIVFGPLGHIYLGRKFIWWVLLCSGIYAVTRSAFGTTIGVIVGTVFSAMLMHYRFQRKELHKSY